MRSAVRFVPTLAILFLFCSACPPAAWAQSPWTDLAQRNVTNTFGHGARAIPYDMDRDGDRDLICSYTLADSVYLALNTNGTGLNWQLVQVAPDIVALTALPFDADCDGDRDIAAVGLFARPDFETPGKVSWYERPPLLTTPNWVENVIDNTLVHYYTLDTGDIDGDTDEDLLVATTSTTAANQVVWYENRCGEPAGLRWQRWTVAIDPAFVSAGSARLADIDGDGAPDVVAADYRGNRVLWYANEGNPRRNDWTGRDIVNNPIDYAGPNSARPYDMDGDGDQDVLVAFLDGSRVDWFEHPANPITDPWTPHPVTTVTTGFLPAKDLVRDDLNNDRLPDIAVISGGTDTLAVFQNNGDETYTRQMPDGNYPGANFVDTGDMDGDGDADLASGSYYGDSIDWWENLHTVSPALNPKEASLTGNMTAAKGPGSSIAVTYTPASCATNHAIYWDRGPIVPGADWFGVACGRGTTGATSFDPGTPPPGQFVYFVIVGQNATQEGSYGRSSAGVERSDAVYFGSCDRPTIVTGSCP